ncbi:lipopolysaccharide biosynthesis protein [Hydrogenimonas urashimensis]|uniref:lipopolysaccharide biosynthesis protein n=1 Tax=Hydrogenimonas urashimensis TaxID=2740515 RepID=UPI001916A8CD|nr:oligosaccharide flippase family protein [Hydrogenimonas urashimensis]
MAAQTGQRAQTPVEKKFRLHAQVSFRDDAVQSQKILIMFFSNIFNNLKVLKNLDPASMNLFKHIGLSSIFKVGSIIVSFFLVPLSINYLGKENYGLWLTLFSFLGWFAIADFGIGNGLRNKLAQTLASDNYELAKGYVSTAYISTAIISFITFILFITIFPFIPWHSIFNYNPIDLSVSHLILISFFFFSINLSLKNISILFYADQKASIPELLTFIGQLFILICVYIMMHITTTSIFLYGMIVLGIPVIIHMVVTFMAFTGKYNIIKPSFKYFKKELITDILNLGGKFFIIQISYIILYTTDNFIINKILGSSDVTAYNITYKYFMVMLTITTLITTPYWSAFTNAYTKNDSIWLHKSMKLLTKISIIISILTFLMIFIANRIYDIWIGNVIDIPFLLTFFMGITTILRIYRYPFVMFINGTGKIQIQLYLGFFLALTNIPLSIYLAKNAHFGVSGVILATLLVNAIEIIVFPIQVNKIIHNKASGIWNK